MTHYRLYLLAAASGRIHSALDIEADSDGDAIRAAKPLQEDLSIEIWCGARKVHRLEAPVSALLERQLEHKARSQFQTVGK